jgi:hypothetical protein
MNFELATGASTNATVMTLLANGSVGIGTTAPGARLDIGGGDIFVRTSGRVLTDTVETYTGGATPLTLKAANTIVLTTASTERMRITSAGDVGIGTTAPLAKLNVEGGNILLRGGFMDIGPTAGANGAGRISSALGGGGLSGSLIFSTLTSSAAMVEAMRITDTGNVGIGTASPTAKLQVGTVGTSFGASEVNLALTGANGFFNSSLLFASENTNVRFQNKFLVDTGALLWQNSTDGTNYTERMRIDSSGNVGIGYSTLYDKLQVAGSVSSQGGGYFGFYRNGPTNNTGTLDGVTVTQFGISAGVATGRSDASTWLAGFDSLRLVTAGIERARIDGSGNVGIGTATPGSLLTVNGNILAPWTNSGTYEIGVEQRSTNAFSTNTNVFVVRGADAIAGGNAMGGGSVLIRGGKGFGTAGGSAGNVTIQGGADVGGATTTPGVIIFNTGAPTTEVMRINAAGLVGIGTSAPGYRLDVNSGDTANTLNISSNSLATYNPGGYNGASARVFMRGGNSVGTFTGTQFTHGGNFEAFFGAVQNASNLADFVFQGYNGSAYVERMRISAAGNVGIGTTAPAERLDVAGNVLLTGASTGDQFIKVGASRSGNGFSFIDLQGDTTYSSGLRIIRTNLGANTPSNIEHYGTGAFQLITQQAAPILFLTNGTEKMRISSDGNLLVGCTSTAFAGGSNTGIYLTNTTGGTGGLHIKNTANNTGTNVITFYGWNDTQTGSILTYVNVTNYNTSSDARLKHDIVDAPEASSLIDAIKVRSFKWNSDNSHQRYGMVAQELVTVAPEAVSQPADPDDMMGVDYSKLVPMLVKELQSLRARVAQLEGN